MQFIYYDKLQFSVDTSCGVGTAYKWKKAAEQQTEISIITDERERISVVCRRDSMCVFIVGFGKCVKQWRWVGYFKKGWLVTGRKRNLKKNGLFLVLNSLLVYFCWKPIFFARPQ